MGGEAGCLHVSCVEALCLQEHISFCRMPFLSPFSHFRGMNVNGSGAACERRCRAAECSQSGRSAGTRRAVMARGQQGFYGSNVTDI